MVYSVTDRPSRYTPIRYPAFGLPLTLTGYATQIYCNADFLVVISDGSPSFNNSLLSVPRPPGGTCIAGGTTCDYAGQCVTRNRVHQYFIWKAPLTTNALSTADATINNVKAFPATTDKGARVGMWPERACMESRDMRASTCV